MAPALEHYVFVASTDRRWYARGCPREAVVGVWSGPQDELKSFLPGAPEGRAGSAAHAEAQLAYAFDFASRAAAESAACAVLCSVGRGRAEAEGADGMQLLRSKPCLAVASAVTGEAEVEALLGALFEAAGRAPPVYSLPRELLW